MIFFALCISVLRSTVGGGGGGGVKISLPTLLEYRFRGSLEEDG